jgi:hypothetical protein
VWLLLFSSGPLFAAQNQDQSVRESVDSFCEFEFNGAQDPSHRAELVQFSDARLAEIRKIMNDVNPYLFEWQASPLWVIESFKVSKISVSGLEASADVDYVIVAQRDSWNGPMQTVPRKVAHSQLQLKQFGTRWKIIDPPYPKVSKSFLSASYRDIFHLPETWYQHASRAQLLWLRNAIDSLLLLDSLDSHP